MADISIDRLPLKYHLSCSQYLKAESEVQQELSQFVSSKRIEKERASKVKRGTKGRGNVIVHRLLSIHGNGHCALGV